MDTNTAEYQKRRDYFLTIMRKQNAQWERSEHNEEKVRKPLKNKPKTAEKIKVKRFI